MKLLAFDCTDQACSVALKIGEELVEQHIEEPRQHSKQLLSTIDGLLSDSSAQLNELDGIAFAAGPGSFTGLRIAISVAQALGFAHHKPLYPISSLHALAATALRELSLEADWTIVPLFDARMQQLYWASFAAEGGVLSRLSDDKLDNVAAVERESFPSSGCVFVGPGAKFLESHEGSHHPELQIHAQDLIDLAAKDVANHRGIEPWEAQPAYLRGSEAWKKLDKQGVKG